jgi:hypothetical protein
MRLLFSLAMLGLGVLTLVLPIGVASNLAPAIGVTLDGVQGAASLACILVSAQVACAGRETASPTGQEACAVRPVIGSMWVPKCA